MTTEILDNRIRFTTRNGPKGLSVGLQIGRHWVSESYFRYVEKRVVDALPYLDKAKKYKAEDIINAPDWPDKKIGTRIAYGRCLSFYVDRGMVPLKLMNPDKKGPRLYCPI